MMFHDFYARREDCFLCNEQMQTFASFVLLAKHWGQIEVAGDILYVFDPATNSFDKEDFSSVEQGEEGLAIFLEEAFDNVADSFNPLVKTFPRIGQSKLRNIIDSPWRLSAVGMTLSKCCTNDEHYFSYEADTVFSYDKQVFRTFAENMDTYDINITNLYDTHNTKTLIHSTKLGIDFSMATKPIDSWNTDNKKTFIDEVHRYAILH